MSGSDLTGGDDFGTMKPSEWLKISAAITKRWPHADLSEATIAQWGHDLADLPGAQVAAGLESLYRDGREFPPNAGQIRQRVAELAVGAPDWAEAFRAMSKIAGLGSLPTFVDGEPIYKRDLALEEADPLIRAFIRSVGFTEIRRAEGNAEARLREKWAAFVKRATRSEAYRGIPAGGLRELEQIQTGPRRLGDVPQLTDGRKAA